MWIRSQNRKTLAKVISFNICKNIRLNENDKFEINGITGGDDYWTLGLYESEKRALEVLDDIQNIIQRVQIEVDKNGNQICSKMNHEPFYQMPEK